MAEISKHYEKERGFREEAIKKFFGEEGKVIHSTVKWDDKRKKYFFYEITENAVLIVKDYKKDFIITKMLARPSRIKKYWENPTEEVMKKAIENARNPKRFK